MTRVFLSRLTQAMVVLLLVSMATFALLRLSPGDPGVLLYGPNATIQDLEQARQRWGLDQPIYLQYLHWLGNAITGELGRSYADGRPVSIVVLERVPATLTLAGTALLIAAIAGVGLGTLAAARSQSAIDRAISLVATILYSTPAFWLGILLILVFSVGLGWLPSGGIRQPGGGSDPLDLLSHLVLPASVLALRDAGRFTRVTRASVLEVMGQDYIRTAEAKGLRPRTIALRHTLRNALLPMISLLGIALPGLFGGAVVVETVFGWPGLGRLVIESALQRNYPVVMGEVLLVAAMALTGSVLADVACGIADPRLARARRG